MINEALVCWIIAAVMLPGALLVLLLISLLLTPRSHPSQNAIQMNLDKFIGISQAHDVLFDLEQSSQEGMDPFKKRYQELAEEARKEDADSPLVMVG